MPSLWGGTSLFPAKKLCTLAEASGVYVQTLQNKLSKAEYIPLDPQEQQCS